MPLTASPIKEMDQLPKMVAAMEVGKKVKVGALQGGQADEVEVTIDRRQRRKARGRKPADPQVEKNFGLVVQNITPEIAHHLGVKDTRGVIVTDVQQGSPADEADIRAGDIVKEINRKVVRNVSDFRELMGKASAKEGIVMLVKRENMTFYAVIKSQ